MSLGLLLAGYLWGGIGPEDQALAARFTPPAGYHRVAVAPSSFGAWLRGVPLKHGRPAVQLFDGRLKSNQSIHLAVVDIDVGTQDLQQCADAVMRLRGEYLYSAGRTEDVAFHFTSGDLARFDDWAAGQRPRVSGSRVSWSRTGARDGSYRSFRRFMETVFRYAGSKSLEKELAPVSVTDVRPGDVFVQGGFPGHAVLVMDVAERLHGGRVFMLAQSYMPAQEIHILKNPANGDAWFLIQPGERLETPEWSFPPDSLRRFP